MLLIFISKPRLTTQIFGVNGLYVFYSSKDRNTKSANPIKTNQKQTTLQQTKEKSGKIKINLT